ncbi:Hypothetical protein LUCI_3733 [Lucifera butyrica]|uniref:Uncharacterized protein n=1 Tax=Lucifera butyrica TaxID=1351585 RepID=A0A498RAL2_9FIRM|nr:hypothetical protein [Lucifera butyrica]VBB08461.1 Hypothetical protein LUCI_3733 [Lucifera butyrica]
MPKRKSKDAEIRVYLTAAQKLQIEKLAAINEKSVSQYLLDAGLSSSLDSAKMDFYTRINNDLTYLKRISYVNSKLGLLAAAEQTNDQDFAVKFYKATLEEAEKLFKEDQG